MRWYVKNRIHEKINFNFVNLVKSNSLITLLHIYINTVLQRKSPFTDEAFVDYLNSFNFFCDVKEKFWGGSIGL